MSHKDGFDSNKRWGNSAQKGHGVNSPAMMEARKSSKSKALHAKKEGKEPKWKIESGKKVNKAFKALAKKNDNWETKDAL